jgi:hypothetical protein
MGSWAAVGTAAALSCAQGCTAFFGYDDVDFESEVNGTDETTSPSCTPSDGSAAPGDACGVFASWDLGDDDAGDGSRAKPFRTLGRALSEDRTVYACAGAPFAEAVAIAGTATIFGGLDCMKGWVYAAGKKSAWSAPAGEVPLRVNEGASLKLRDFALVAESAKAPGGSSIAVVAAAGATIDLRRCEVAAADGASGAAPGDVAPPGADGAPGLQGDDGCTGVAPVTAPGLGGVTVCGASDVAGGAGGPGLPGTAGADGSDGTPGPGPIDAGLGGKRQDATACGDGIAGAKGDHGGPGAGATLLGTLSHEGYVGANGAPGGAGLAGHGGGGGGGAKMCADAKAGPGGGGGGAGACGGAGGEGGGAGGASIALVALHANLVLVDVAITTGSGGKGASGAQGGPGGAGGAGGVPGAGDAVAAACAGGAGGDGGKGGRGGGGRGGHSIGIAYRGLTPAVLDTTLWLGPPGAGGDGDGSAGDGAPGIAAEVQGFD